MSYRLFFDDVYEGEFDSLLDCVRYVREDYDTMPGPSYPFHLWRVFREVEGEFHKTLATNKRGSIPHSYRGEGINYVD